MGSQADGDSAADHVCSYFQDFALAAQERDVDGEFHAEGVDGLGRDQEAFAGVELQVFQEAGVALGHGVGNVGPVG